VDIFGIYYINPVRRNLVPMLIAMEIEMPPMNGRIKCLASVEQTERMQNGQIFLRELAVVVKQADRTYWPKLFKTTVVESVIGVPIGIAIGQAVVYLTRSFQ
jgi:hypothetical protein